MKFKKSLLFGEKKNTGYVTILKATQSDFDNFQHAMKFNTTIAEIFAVYKGSQPWVLYQSKVLDTHWENSRLSVYAEVKWASAELVRGELARMILDGSAAEGIDGMWKNQTR